MPNPNTRRAREVSQIETVVNQGIPIERLIDIMCCASPVGGGTNLPEELGEIALYEQLWRRMNGNPETLQQMRHILRTVRPQGAVVESIEEDRSPLAVGDYVVFSQSLMDSPSIIRKGTIATVGHISGLDARVILMASPDDRPATVSVLRDTNEGTAVVPKNILKKVKVVERVERPTRIYLVRDDGICVGSIQNKPLRKSRSGTPVLRWGEYSFPVLPLVRDVKMLMEREIKESAGRQTRQVEEFPSVY